MHSSFFHILVRTTMVTQKDFDVAEKGNIDLIFDRLLSVKANSHIPCRSHAALMPFPCHAAPLRGWVVSFLFDLHSAAMLDSHMPCRARAMPWPCRSESYFSRPKHSAAWTWHDVISIGRPETTCGRPACVRLLPATTRISTKDTALSENGRGAAWHVWINAVRHGRGTTWGRHGRGKACMN
jgi:hypothetical protein